ncbi:MAG: DEAD/DEAH box helicase [Akkermansiaceae bacterium]|nr:DEAD/DEAH box helicase [Akkermansiaceae bacterium]MCF7731612.1 DEAD/DEAH box helicase [Akkermansiaceae bacterium]
MPAKPSPTARKPAKKSAKRKATAVPLPPAADWRTTDQDEILRRVQRARDEKHTVSNLNPEHPVFSNFRVASPSGMVYQTEIRDLANRSFACSCPDFRINGLGTCKHIEATLIWLKRRLKGEFRLARQAGSRRIDLVAVGDTLCIERNLPQLPASLKPYFDPSGTLVGDPTVVLDKAARLRWFRVSQEVASFLESRRRTEERRQLRRDYETGVVEGRHPEHVTLCPLYPYQREGMLHLAFGERALLADEMGLGKTIQAIAACALLHHLGKARRVLIVTPASLKAEWEEQIRRFTTLTHRLIYGPRAVRARYYADPDPPFFTIVNYEQVVSDSLDLNARLQPDIVVLDEAQRIKNWATKTAQAVKRLQSRYAFVLTGTPIENRIDELYSIIDFLDPTLLGPLFRFNRTFYQFDDKGRPSDYQNLSALRERVQPILIRRRKHHVETELPDRTDHNHFVKLTPAMQADYDECKIQVSQLVQISLRRPLTLKQQELMLMLLAMMRMICDTPSIIKSRDCQDCPKLKELARILDECLVDPDVKVIIFSEWEGMLAKVRGLAEKMGVGYAWHTGTVPQQRRRGEIIAFRDDPACRLFLSTDSGGVGLNLQMASVVINCDLPWNPARLEQRIARAWRKHQRRAVTVINLIAENTIEHAMLETLANKMNLAEGVLDGTEGALDKAKLKRGKEATLARLQQLLSLPSTVARPVPKPAPADPLVAFAERAAGALGGALLHCEEAVLPGQASPVLLTVLRHRDRTAALEALYRDTDWRGSPPVLQVLDEATWAAVQQLAAAGLVTFNTRATRALVGTPSPTLPSLTPAQLERIASLKTFAARKEKAASLLEAADLAEEAEPHRRAAVKALAAARAIENHQPEPDAGPVRQPA